jgi:hypothetical protein
MKRISPVLVLLLAISLVAASAPLPAAYAVPTSGGISGVSGNGGTIVAPTGASGTTSSGGGEQGDPGGAGDGLGADPQLRTNASVQTSGAAALVEFVLQALRLMQAAG